MDIAALQAYAQTHPAAYGAACAAAGACAPSPATCADAVFGLVMKSPAKGLVLWAWPKIKANLDAFEDRFNLDVAAEQAAQAAAPAAAPAPQAAAPAAPPAP